MTSIRDQSVHKTLINIWHSCVFKSNLPRLSLFRNNSRIWCPFAISDSETFSAQSCSTFVVICAGDKVYISLTLYPILDRICPCIDSG